MAFILASNEMVTYRFEKKFVKRDVDCCSGGFFWPNIGVDGAEPRLHAFSYDVSAKGKKQKISISFDVESGEASTGEVV